MPLREGDIARLKALGALHLPDMLSHADMQAFGRFCGRHDDGNAGERVTSVPPFAGVDGCVGQNARDLIGMHARPVRAVLFDKRAYNNWPLGWHQDRTIAVAARHDAAGFGPWSRKAGIAHVEPPFDILARMLTIRIHLDAVDEHNAPLRVAVGSHRRGRIAEGEIEGIVGACAEMLCLARPGDIWVYATPVLHASAPVVRSAGRRRVLQVDYSADPLPPPLAWFGLNVDPGISQAPLEMAARLA